VKLWKDPFPDILMAIIIVCVAFTSLYGVCAMFSSGPKPPELDIAEKVAEYLKEHPLKQGQQIHLQVDGSWRDLHARLSVEPGPAQPPGHP